MKKTNYFYIDEAGGIWDNSQRLFIHGCVKTDNPDDLQSALNQLENEIYEDIYFAELVDRFKKEGFHASKNNQKIQDRFHAILPLLDYRAYFVILDKKTEFFNHLSKVKQEWEIFEWSLDRLIRDRVKKNKRDKNIFYFEEINVKGKAFSKIIERIFDSFDCSYDCDHHIVKKKDEKNLAVIDYLNAVLFKVVQNEIDYLAGIKQRPRLDRMVMNFNLIAPKIGLINLFHTDQFLSRRKEINKKVNYTNLIKGFGGQIG